MNRKLHLFLLATASFMFLLTLGSASYAQAPIPNGGFESWTNNSPDNWYITPGIGGSSPITQSSDAHLGSSALRAEVGGIIPLAPTAHLGSDPTKLGIPYTDRPSTFSCFVKFSPQSGDSLRFIVLFSKAGSGIGGTIITTGDAISEYKSFQVPVFWKVGDSPDTLSIQILVSGPGSGTSATAPHTGTVALVDDLSFSTSGVNSPNAASSFSLSQNYPNPFNPSTEINYTLTDPAYTTLNVFDVTGKQVASLIHEKQSAGTYKANFDATGLPSGVYYYRLTSGANTSGHWMQLVK